MRKSPFVLLALPKTAYHTQNLHAPAHCCSTPLQVVFDLFLVLEPLASGPARKLLYHAENSQRWWEWAQAVLVVWAMGVTVAFLVFYNTGLFWQVLSSMYSTLVLGLRQRLGHVK